MSGWSRLLEEESEHQWLSFAIFSVIVIIGAVLIDWSSELSGVHEGSTLEVDGIVIDSAGDAILYENGDGVRLAVNDLDQNAQYATCLTQHGKITFACMGDEGSISFVEEGNDFCEESWCLYDIGENLTASQVSGNGQALLMVVQDGTSDSLAAIWINSEDKDPAVTELEAKMYLDVIVPNDEGWLVGGSWQAPVNWLGTNPTSPPMFELVISVTWDGVSAPDVEIIYMGNEGTIHGIFETDEGFIATGTSDTISIIGDEISSFGINSYAAAGDNNGDVWLFGGIGSKTVAIISDGDMSIEKLPEPMNIIPTYVNCDEDGMISIHGANSEDKSESLSIDSNARSSFLSMRGILDLGFILVSLLIIGIMSWNIFDAIRKGEVF